ncbi:MAG: Uma2 family endonuclease [Thermomicrobia bacterium]|nr:Uma2 family endonuclease [Thermomicrobia bacterium]MCA1723833.1 Uma2 family endonuclease [Thermomicrobia bacterium]
MAMVMPRRRFTVDEYEQMAVSGILHEDDRVELIAGEIIEMSPIGVRHMNCVNRLNQILNRLLPDDVVISIQNPILLSDNSQPQPDLVILYDRNYQTVPTAADAPVVIEVADSSRDHDRGFKFPIYAAAGIAEAWLIDLTAETIERHTEPHDGRYRFIALAGRGESLPSTIFPTVTLAADTAFA